MVEGFSAPPPDEEREVSVPEAPPLKRGIKGMLDTIRFNMLQSREYKKDDEEDDEKKGRFGRLLRRIFTGIVDKEDVAPDQPDRPGLFFGIGEVNDTTVEPTQETNHTETPQTTPEFQTHDNDVTNVESAETEDNSLESTTEYSPTIAPSVEAIEQTPVSPVIERDPTVTDEVVYVDRQRFPGAAYRAYEHHRVQELKDREDKLEKEVKDLHKQAEKSASKRETTVEKPRIEKEPEVRTIETLVPKIKTPERRTVATETSPEQRRAAVEKAVERHNKALSTERKQEIIERILVAPEFNGALDSEVHKDITYELSHEHKDMDKQSQAAWTALQAAADATAKANAQALAAASQNIDATSDDPVAKAAAKKAMESSGLYKKAAVSGVVTAIIIIAILFVVLLLIKK